MKSILLISLVLAACSGSTSDAQTVPVRLIQTQGRQMLENNLAVDWYIAAEKIWNSQMSFKLSLRSLEVSYEQYPQSMSLWPFVIDSVVMDNDLFDCANNHVCLFVMPPIFEADDLRPWFAGMSYIGLYGDYKSSVPAVATVHTTATRFNGKTAKWITVHIMLHELGHLVCGLKHAAQEPISVMSPAMSEIVAEGGANEFGPAEINLCGNHLARVGKVLIRRAYSAVRRAETLKQAKRLRRILNKRQVQWRVM